MPIPDTLPHISIVTSSHGWLWLRDGYSLFMQSPLNWLAMCLIFVSGILLFSAIPILSQLVQVIAPGITAGLMLAAHALRRGNAINPGYLLAGFRRNRNELLLLGLISFIANTFIMLLATVLLGLFTDASIIDIINNLQSGAPPEEKMLSDLLYLAVLLATLTLPLMMALWFAPALIVLNNVKAWDAFKLSFKASHRNIIPFLVFGLVSTSLFVLAALPFGLGLIVLTPVIFCSIYCSWNDILGETKTEANSA